MRITHRTILVWAAVLLQTQLVDLDVLRSTLERLEKVNGLVGGSLRARSLGSIRIALGGKLDRRRWTTLLGHFGSRSLGILAVCNSTCDSLCLLKDGHGGDEGQGDVQGN